MAGRSNRSAGHLSLFVLLVLAVVAAACRSSSRPGAGSTTTGQPAATSATTAGATAPPKATSSTVASSTVAPSTAACGWAAAAPATYQHVIWIWMENHAWPEVLGDARAAPYEVGLAAQCATATNYRSVGRPSLPNYIGATSGSVQGISDDASPPSHPLTVDNLFRQARASGGTERSYQEDMAQPCQLAPSGQYAVKHNPAAYYVGPNGQDRGACQRDDVALADMTRDVSAGTLPTFAFVTPNLCHDTHDCAVATGDTWLAATLPSLLASTAYRAGTTAIFVIWDEQSPMPNIVIGPAVRPGSVVTKAVDHFSLLRTTEELLGLPGRLGAAATAPSLRPLFNL